MSLDENLSSRRVQGNWQALWKIKVPPKIKQFLWRACRDCLPHRINLQKRGIQVSSLCVLCHEALETSWHIFTACPYARECWDRAKLIQEVDSQRSSAESFSALIFNIIQKLSGVELGIFASILWAIWKQRNSMLWHNHTENPQRVLTLAMSFLSEWTSAKEHNKEIHERSTENHTYRWIAPPAGSVKCNIDAAFFKDINYAGVSMVIRDEEGNFLSARTKLIKGLSSVKEGEAIGLLEALSWLRNQDYPNVLFEVDAKAVYDALKEIRTDNTEFGGILERCRNIVTTNPGFSVHVIRRQANEIAHVLARQSRFYASPFVWVETPSCIGDLLNMYSAISLIE